MKCGAIIFPTEETIHPARLARELEARGFESLFVPEHTHIPVERRSPYPGGGDLPREYWRTYDPFVALSQAAAVTERLRVGTGICLVTERDPLVLAKEVASLDALSGGRFLFGIGAGWNAEEMENHGTAFADRWSVLRDRVLAMKALWTTDESRYHGRHADFAPVVSLPKPHQRPHPPILIGAFSARAYRRIAEYGDGWIPIFLATSLEQEIPVFRRVLEEAGRDPDSATISVFGAPSREADLERLRALGVDRAIIQLPHAEEGRVLAKLDRCAPLVERFHD